MSVQNFLRINTNLRLDLAEPEDAFEELNFSQSYLSNERPAKITVISPDGYVQSTTTLESAHWAYPSPRQVIKIEDLEFVRLIQLDEYEMENFTQALGGLDRSCIQLC